MTLGRRLFVGGAFILSVAAIGFLIRGRSIVIIQKPVIGLETPAAGECHDRPLPASALQTEWPTFAKHLNLSEGEVFRVQEALSGVGERWMELKGRNAAVLDVTDGGLRMHIRGLGLSEDEASAEISRAVASVLGSAAASTVLKDAAFRREILSWANYDMVIADATYEFDRVRDEGDWSLLGEKAFATFDVKATFRFLSPRFNTRLVGNTWEHRGFTVADASKPAIPGQAALAAAPSGYFISHRLREQLAKYDVPAYGVFVDEDGSAIVDGPCPNGAPEVLTRDEISGPPNGRK